MVAGSGLAAQIAELEDAIVRCPEHRRALVLQQVTKHFLGEHREIALKLTALDDVIVCLLRSANTSDLVNVSTALVKSNLELPKVARQLARHTDPAVALPMLMHSGCIAEEDLVEVAETGDQQRLLAIASRSFVSERLTTTLVMRGHGGVRAAICRNAGSRFSEAGFTMLLKIAERDHKLAERLGTRSDIPVTLLRKFLALVTGEPRSAFLRSAPPSVRAIAERETPKIVISNRNYSSAEKEMMELRRTGKLNDSMINRFAIQQEREKLTVALSLLAEAPLNVIDGLLSREGDVYQLAIACRAARLRWATTASILRCHQGSAPISQQEVEELGGLFESMSLSEAQWTIRFGASDGS